MHVHALAETQVCGSGCGDWTSRRLLTYTLEVSPRLGTRLPDMEVPSLLPLLARNLHKRRQQDAVADVVEEKGRAAVEPEEDVWGEAGGLEDQRQNRNDHAYLGREHQEGDVPGGVLEGEQVPPVLANAGHAVLGTDALDILLDSHGHVDVVETFDGDNGKGDDPSLDASSAGIDWAEETD